MPQNYLKSNALGKWVAKQREQYCYHQEGKHSFLTDERIDLLNSIGFVWRLKGKGINKNKNAPAMMPKVQSAIQRKIAAKMKEEETKMVELKSAMSIVPSEEDRNLKPPALLLSSTTTPLFGVECNQSELVRRIGIGYGTGGSDAGGAASGAAAAAAMVGNNPKAKQAITYLPMTFHASNGHGGWLC